MFCQKGIAVRQDGEWPFVSLEQEINRLFGDVDQAEGTASAFAPRLDIVENEQDIRVTAQLPGVEDNDVEVTLSEGILTISGEKKTEHKEEDKRCYRLERSYGTFQRAIPLPTEVDDQDKIAASFKNGVLTITLPKTATAQPQTRKIPVKAE